MNSTGALIAHPRYKDKIRNLKGSLQVGDIEHDGSSLGDIIKIAQKHVPINGGSGDKQVFELDSNYLVAIARIQGPDWYIVTLYPRSLISDAAFDASRFILAFGCLGLIVELLLLMALIKKKLGRPLKELVTVVQRISAGDLQAKIHLQTQDEFEILGDAFNEMTYNLGLSKAESQAAIQKALEASKVKSQFVANMSHEMRTPLNGILGMAHFLSDSRLNHDQKKYAAYISESGNQLLNIINQVLDVANIQDNKQSLTEQKFKITEVLEELKSLYYFSAIEKGLPLDFEIKIENRDEYWGDVSRLKQILSNLIGNAIKFSNVGTIKITVTEFLCLKTKAKSGLKS